MTVQRYLHAALVKDKCSEELNVSNYGLSTLDGIMEILLQFTNLRYLDLGGNQLAEFPKQFVHLKSLRALNIAHNQFKSIHAVLPTLKALRSLQSLAITFNSDVEQEMLLSALTGLKILNGVLLSKCKQEIDFKINDCGPEIKKTSMERELFIDIPIRNNESSCIGLEQNFATHYDMEGLDPGYVDMTTSIFNGLQSNEDYRNNKLPRNDGLCKSIELATQSMQNTIIYHAKDTYQYRSEAECNKFKLLQVCLERAMMISSSATPNLSIPLQRLSKEISSIVQNFKTIVQHQTKHCEQVLREQQTAVAEAQQQVEVYTNQIEKLNRQTNTELPQKISAIRPMELTQDDAIDRSNVFRPKSPYQAPINPIAEIVHSPRKSTISVMEPIKAGESPSPAKLMEYDKDKQVEVANVKMLSLKQLKDNVLNILEAKKHSDRKRAEARQPLESMEQYFYAYLNQQFGLKCLVLEHANSILKSVAELAHLDADVSYFGHLMRNEIDENFGVIRQRLKETIVELLRLCLRGKFPVKSDAAIVEMVVSRQADCIHEDEWNHILKYLYSPHDRMRVTQTLLASADLNILRNGEQKKKIRYQEFCQIILRYQLECRMDLLSEFCRHYTNNDIEGTGIMSRKAVTQFLKDWDAQENYVRKDIDRILRSVDPYHNDAITFSQLVDCLFDDIVQRESDATRKERRSILHGVRD